jgi:hypothetical protein
MLRSVSRVAIGGSSKRPPADPAGGRGADVEVSATAVAAEGGPTGTRDCGWRTHPPPQPLVPGLQFEMTRMRLSDGEWESDHHGWAPCGRCPRPDGGGQSIASKRPAGGSCGQADPGEQATPSLAGLYDEQGVDRPRRSRGRAASTPTKKPTRRWAPRARCKCAWAPPRDAWRRRECAGSLAELCGTRSTRYIPNTTQTDLQIARCRKRAPGGYWRSLADFDCLVQP